MQKEVGKPVMLDFGYGCVKNREHIWVDERVQNFNDSLVLDSLYVR